MSFLLALSWLLEDLPCKSKVQKLIMDVKELVCKELFFKTYLVEYWFDFALLIETIHLRCLLTLGYWYHFLHKQFWSLNSNSENYCIQHYIDKILNGQIFQSIFLHKNLVVFVGTNLENHHNSHHDLNKPYYIGRFDFCCFFQNIFLGKYQIQTLISGLKD